VAAPDCSAAASWNRRAADTGHASAMYEMARFHQARKDHEQAVEWFTKAAEAGLPRAMYDLGQGLTLVHFSAQLERFVWDRGGA